MARRSPPRQRFLSFLLAIIVLGGLLALGLVLAKERSFPPLGKGSYVGRVHGLAIDPSSDTTPHTFYVERLIDPDAFFIVVFKEGWKPQIVSANRLSGNDAPSPTGHSVPFQPLVAHHYDLSFTFFGEEDNGSYSGEIIGSDGSQGQWALRSIPTQAADNSLPEDYLTAWLEEKIRWRLLRKELKRFENSLEKRKEKLQKLEHYMSDEVLLRQRAEKRRETLASEVKELRKQRKEVGQQVRTLVSELGLMQRISKRGQTVKLARQLSRRENKWYMANWGTSRESPEVEENLADKANIDLRKLNYSLRRAEEIQNLRRIISSEKEQIIRLRARMEEERGYSRDHKPGKRRDGYKPGKGGRSWWDIFG